MWHSVISHLRAARLNRPLIRAKRVGFESLEPRLAMTWVGVPPASITPPSNATTVVLDEQGDAGGLAAISDSEVDYYSFIASASGTYTISTATSAFSNLDTVLGLFSATGQRIAYNDDISYFNTDSWLTVNLSAATRYYIGITNYDSWQQDYYTWSIDGPDASPTPTIDLSGAALSASNASGWGKTITVQAEVQNTGNTDSGTFLVRWYLARDSAAATGRVSLQRTDADRTSVRVENVAAGGSVTINVTLQLPSKAPSGWSGSSFYLVMGTDVSNEVDEVNENNNLGQVGSGYDYDPITIGTTTSPPTGSFTIKLDMSGLTSSQRGIFQRAADRWEQVITGDLPNATYGGQAVDDLLIGASARSIDGVNGILGQAGPDALRSGSRLPYHGIMQFDSADLASMERSGILLGVVMHEMGHVLGIGTIWEDKGLLSGAGGSNPTFTGSRATAAYNNIFGTSARGVPVENTGGPGTADAHWRESVFSTELMTGWVGPGSNMPLSRVTAASLADLGYSVNMAAADAFTPSSSGRSAARQASSSGSASIIAALDALTAGVADLAPQPMSLNSTAFAFADASISVIAERPAALLPDRFTSYLLSPSLVDTSLASLAEREESAAEEQDETADMIGLQLAV